MEEKDEGRKRRWTQRFGDFVWDNEFKQQGFMYKEAGRYIINEEKKENFLRYINGLEEASNAADTRQGSWSFCKHLRPLSGRFCYAVKHEFLTCNTSAGVKAD